MQVSSEPGRTRSRHSGGGRPTTANTARKKSVGTASCQSANIVDAATDAEAGVMKIRGCRISAPVTALWGECCRIVEWINAQGEYSCTAVPVDAAESEIRQRVRTHRNGQRHTFMDEPGLPQYRVRLRRT